MSTDVPFRAGGIRAQIRRSHRRRNWVTPA